MSKKAKPYDVGFGRPPRATQFKKGQSGNPNGRGKGKLNLATLFDKELQAPILVVENGKSRKIAKGSAIVKQTVNKAVGGDPKQIAVVLAHDRHQGAIRETSAASSLDSEEDRLVMENIKRRMLVALNSTTAAEIEPAPTDNIAAETDTAISIKEIEP